MMAPTTTAPTVTMALTATTALTETTAPTAEMQFLYCQLQEKHLTKSHIL